MSVVAIRRVILGVCSCLMLSVVSVWGQEAVELPKATIDGTGLGWRQLGEADFVNVNTDPDTWTWKDGMVHCTGKPVGVTRSTKPITNFELVAMWRHLKAGGNSGIFVWATEEALAGFLPRQCLPVRIAPEDVVGPVLFLSSDAARVVTGQVLPVDAGVVHGG